MVEMVRVAGHGVPFIPHGSLATQASAHGDKLSALRRVAGAVVGEQGKSGETDRLHMTRGARYDVRLPP